MILEDRNNETLRQNQAVAARLQEVGPSGARVEPCEFESLVERAMQILNARALSLSS